jgi:hypothetical protein
MEVGSQIHTPAALPVATEPPDGPQSHSERGGGIDSSSFSESNLDPPVHSYPVHLLWESWPDPATVHVHLHDQIFWDWFQCWRLFIMVVEWELRLT